MKTKSIKTGIALIVAGMCISTQLSAQSTSSLRRLENKADKAYNNRQYAKSLALFLQIDNIANDPVSYYDYRIGMNLLSTDNKVDALPYLERAKAGGQTSFVIDYYLGRAYMFAGMYDHAKFYLSAYARQFVASGKTFGYKEVAASPEHAIHVEKTMNDVYGLLAQCDAELNGPVYSNR